MPKQYCFEVWRAGKAKTKYYNICHDDEQALAWITAQAKHWEWGEHGLDWTAGITSRPLTEVYEHDGDKAGYLCEIVEEIFARECSNNCPNTEFRGLSYIDLCEAAIEILEYLKGVGKNVAF